MAKKEKQIVYQGVKRSPEFVKAHQAGFSNPWGTIPREYKDRSGIYEDGQIQRRQCDLVEGTF